VSDTISKLPMVSDLEDILQKVIEIANYSEVRTILKGHCPHSVKTRWLSRCKALDWLLEREGIFLNKMKIDAFSSQRKAIFQEFITEDNFEKLAIYHQLIYPVNEAVKFFERDDATLASVYPALTCLKRYMRENHIDTPMEGYQECRRSMIEFLKERRHKHLDLDLVRAAFWLTSFGALYLADPRQSIPEDHQLRLDYRSPRQSRADSHPLDRFSVSNNSIPQTEEGLGEEFGMECTFQGDDIGEEAIDRASTLRRLERNVLPFLHQFLIQRLREDGDLAMEPPPGAEWPADDIRVEDFIKLFFCNDDWIARCRTTPPSIDKQVELWNFLARLTPDHRYDDLVTKVISIISIPASEATCERTLSRQKRIITHMRARSSPELARARLAFLEFNPPLRE
jgi:hypothetical protein